MPRRHRLKEAFDKVLAVHQQWLAKGDVTRVPKLEEGREPGVVSEIYYMFHFPSGKSYVGMAYHGAHDRMQTHWPGRNRGTDPCSELMKLSASPYDWICWPVERCPGPRKGYVLFHKRMAHREGWWAIRLQTWWPQGGNVAGTGGEYKGGAREDWAKRRHTYQKEWRESMEDRLAKGKEKVLELVRKREEEPDAGLKGCGRRRRTCCRP